MRDSKSWNVKASCYATNTYNPVRAILENLDIVPNPDKNMIALSIGDPTVFGNLQLDKVITDAVVDAAKSGKCNGYACSTGTPEAREAIAEYTQTPESPLEAKDVIMCSGCSCALDISITALCEPGQNILIPSPGFPLYKTLAEGLSIETKYYNLLPEKDWQVDVQMLESMIDNNTAAIVINNPSNPCGSVFTKKHLIEIIAVAERNKVPIIADEIYNHFVFEGKEFHWMASLTSKVPILSCGGLTKRFLVPGWRTGWITIHDRNDIFAKEVRNGLRNLSQRIIGSNSLVMGALSTILKETPKKFFSDAIQVVQENANMSFDLLSSAKGLHPIMPQGAMYMMVRVDMEHFPCIKTDLDLVEKLIFEQSVFCLPGKCFSMPNYLRLVLTVPQGLMKEACHRIIDFCQEHYVLDVTTSPTTVTEVSNEVSKKVNNGIKNEGSNGISSNGSNGVSNGVTNNTTDIINSKALAALKRDIIAAELEVEH